MSEEEIKKSEEVVFCNRCGRPLKSELSKKLGYGPSCYDMWKKERLQHRQLFEIGDSDGTGQQEEKRSQ